ncbi:MAG: NADH-quinone oxidoreductase subunit M [Cyclobacteriaceae bacterium]|jgi:NADH-quinone oxidoreductase subunit M
MIEHLLSWMIFWPLVGVVVLMLWKGAGYKTTRLVTLIFGLVESFLAMLLVLNFHSETGAVAYGEQFQFVQKIEWFSIKLPSFGQFLVSYHVGVDGISIWLVVLTALIMVIGTLASWHYRQQSRGYHILYLVLISSIIGCFVAMDLFLFYLFFELMLLPMFFLIGMWGGPNRSYASIKFFIYTLVGSLLILIVMIGLYISTIDPIMLAEGITQHSFDLLAMSSQLAFLDGSILSPGSGYELFDVPMRSLAFILLIVGFAIKLPIVPFHTWLPDAHVEAPTAISVILAALLLKVGGYGMMRIAYMIFPEAAIDYASWIAAIGVISILYGGLNAMAQRDIKRLVAYSSVSHMGFVMVGLAAMTTEGEMGVVFHMLSHGLISAGLFLAVGVIYDRTHNRLIENFSGLAHRLPGYTFVVVVLFFASLGLPGMSGFVGELLILIGAFQAGTSGSVSIAIGLLATLGIIVSAIYYLWTLQRMFFGKYWVREESWSAKIVDLSFREWLMFLPLIFLIILFGVVPSIILDPMNETIQLFVNHLANNHP